jgi:hypothetical protein
MLVEKGNLKAMNMVDNFEKTDISFELNANFTGNTIDNLAGSIHFKEGNFTNENGDLSFDNIDLKTFYEDEPVLQVRSDFLDADIRGRYQLQNFYNSVKQIITHFVPSSGLTFSEQTAPNNFDFRLKFKDINRFTRVLIPKLQMRPAEIVGSINSEKNTLVLNGVFPEIQYGSTHLQKLAISINGEDQLNVRNKVDEVSIGDQFKIYNLSLISQGVNDELDSKLAWNNYGALSYSGSINTSTKFFPRKNRPHVEINVKPTRIYLADSLWQVNSSLITVDSTVIKVNKFLLSNNGQSVTFDGSIDNRQENKLNIYFNQVDLNSLNRIIGQDLEMKGELNGNLSLFDVYQRPLFLADLRIAKLGLLGQLLGDASVQSRWDRDAEEINAELLVNSGQKNSLHAFGIYSPERDSLSIFTNFDHFSILILQPLMGSSFANVHGDATGKVWIHGPSPKRFWQAPGTIWRLPDCSGNF